MSSTPSYPGLFDAAEAARALAVLADPAGGVELMRLPGGWRVRLSGGDVQGMLEQLARWGSSGASGLYYSLGVVDPALARNALVDDILRRRWLLIDCDPRKPKDTNATDGEKAAARQVAEAVRDYLTGLGWPAPVLIDSGNGYHLLYRIDLPNGPDDGTRPLVMRVLRALAGRFDTPAVTIDTSVGNPNRHGKIPGTWARKGPHSPDRPHRPCRLIHLPDELAIVSRELLAELAGPEPPRPDPSRFVLRVPAGSRYGAVALEREIGGLLLAERRNDGLNKAAFNLFQLVAGGVLTEAEVTARLTEVALHVGLTERETASTLASARRKGMAQPRGIPERPATGGANGATPRSHTPAPPRNGVPVPTRAGAGAVASPTPRPTRTGNSHPEPQSPSAPGPTAGGGTTDPAAGIAGLEDVPTLGHARRHGAGLEWTWPGWILAGKVNGLSGTFGCGKTRLACELIRRVATGQPWPDGAEMTLPADSRFLFVAADYQHGELVEMSREFGFDEESVYLNASLDRPTDTDLLHSQEQVDRLRRRIELVQPALVIVDPMTAANPNLSQCSAEEVTALYQPLQRLADDFRVPVLLLVHQNAQGTAYGRHATGKFRVELSLWRVPQADGDRYRLEVVKSCVKRPAPLGATQSTAGWEFDDNPPDPPLPGGRRGEPGQAGRPPAAREQARQWILERLGQIEEKTCELVREWESTGGDKHSLWRALEELTRNGLVVRGSVPCKGGKGALQTVALAPQS